MDKSITDMVMEGVSSSFAVVTSEEMVTKRVNKARAVAAAGWSCCGRDNRKAKFSAKEKAVSIRSKAMILKPSRKRM